MVADVSTDGEVASVTIVLRSVCCESGTTVICGSGQVRWIAPCPYDQISAEVLPDCMVVEQEPVRGVCTVFIVCMLIAMHAM